MTRRGLLVVPAKVEWVCAHWKSPLLIVLLIFVTNIKVATLWILEKIIIYLHNRARKWFMTFPQFLSSSSNTVAQKSPKTEHVNMMWRVCHVCKKYFSLDCAMQCPRWPGVINDRDYCDTVSAACCSYLEFVFSVWCLVQISGLEGGEGRDSR